MRYKQLPRHAAGVCGQLPGVRRSGGKIEDKAAFQKALETVKFESVRGKFRFNTNHYPFQDFYLTEIVKDAKGRNTLKTIATPMVDAQDAFHDKCPMK